MTCPNCNSEFEGTQCPDCGMVSECPEQTVEAHENTEIEANVSSSAYSKSAKKKANQKKKKIARFIIAVVAFVLVVGGVLLYTMRPDPVVGWYTGIKLIDDEGVMNLTAYSNAFGLTFYAVFNEDGTGYLDMTCGEILKFTYSNGKMDTEGGKAEYKFEDDGTLTIGVEGAQIQYERSEGELPPLSSDDYLKALGIDPNTVN